MNIRIFSLKRFPVTLALLWGFIRCFSHDDSSIDTEAKPEEKNKDNAAKLGQKQAEAANYWPGNRFVMLLLTSLTAMLACDRPCIIQKKINFNFQGVVMDTLGVPIPDAYVSFNKIGLSSGELLATAYTDEDGYYSLSHSLKTCDCNESLYTLKADKTGFYFIPMRNKSVDEIECSKDFQTINFELVSY